MRNIAIVAVVMLGCGEVKPYTFPPSMAVVDAGPSGPTADALLFSYLNGVYDTADQAKTSPEFFEIHLSVCPVQAPELGPRVLYVEQAVSTSLGAPYRQRLYVVDMVPNGRPNEARSQVLELTNPKAVIGLCNQKVAQLSKADTIDRPGCSVTMWWDESAQSFTGATTGKECLSTLNGATYATAEVTLTKTGFNSLDRGWSKDDVQVWGSTKGPYQFVRRTVLEIQQ
jgi:CpeT protein